MRRQNSDTIGEQYLPADSADDAATSEWRAGRLPLIASMLGYGSGLGLVIYMSGLFIRPMQAETGWSTTAVTFSPIISILVGICSPLAGWLVDRWGSRLIAIFGLSLLGSSLLLLAMAPLTQMTLYAIAVLIGVVGPLSSTTPFARCVASWFRARVGFALGLAMNGVPLMAVLVAPILNAVIYRFGWRAGFATLAFIVLVVGLSAVLALMKERPQVRPRSTVASRGLGKNFRSPSFWLVSLSIAAASVPLGGFLMHLASMLAVKNIPIATATSLLMLYAISIMLGRVGGGFLIDRLWDGGVAFFLLGLSAIGAVMLGLAGAGGLMPIIVIGILLVGMGQGVEADMIAYFAQKIFGMEHYSTIVGSWTFVSSLLLAFGSWLFAYLFDHSGSYQSSCIVGAICFLVSGATLLLARLLFAERDAM